MALGKLETDYTAEWHQSFHFTRRPDQPEWLGFVHKSAHVVGNIALGNRSVIGYQSYIEAPAALQIGCFTNIGGHFTLIQGAVHPMNYASQYALNKALQMGLSRPDVCPAKEPVQRIGNDVWIAAHVTLLQDVHIADGCVIGAGSVVTKPTEPYGVYAGNPARLIRYRFPEKHIQALLKLKWWDWPVERIARNSKLFDTDLTVFEGNLADLVVA